MADMTFEVQRNCVIELTFTSTAGHAEAGYTDPYNEVDLDVVFRGPEGNEFRVPAFWAGEDVWKVRFAGDAVGEYAFTTECTNPSDAGLHDQTGTVTVVPYDGDNRWFVHGRLRVASDKRHFEHADGTPFFWVGDTWWMGLTTRCDWPGGFLEPGSNLTWMGIEPQA